MSDKPNIVFLFQDHHAYYGHGKMVGGPEIKRPHFNRVAEDGVEFTRAYTACPLCGPTRRSILTGLFPHNHGEIKNETHHKYDKELFFKKLREEGYDLYYYGKWHAGEGTALDFGCEGFSTPKYGNPYITQEYKNYLKEYNLPPFEVKITHNLYDPESQYNKFLGIKVGESHKLEFISSSEHTAGIMISPKETHEAFFLADLACKKLREIARSGTNTPFHLRVDFWGPHQPYYAPQEYINLYNPKDIPEHPSFNEDLSNKPEIYKYDLNYPISADGKLVYPNPIPWSVWQEILACNYGQQTLIDEALGRILDTLEELGFENNTLLICASDHGDAVGCHGGHFDKDVYMPEEMIRTPFVMKYPGIIPNGIESNKLVSNLDLAPTFLAAAGTKFSDQVDGRNILELFQNKNEYWRTDLMVETNGHFTTHVGRALITSKFKYVYNEDDLDELYNLEDDPYELINLINNESYKDILMDMKQRLKNYRKDTNDDVKKEMIRGKRLRRR